MIGLKHIYPWEGKMNKLFWLKCALVVFTLTAQSVPMIEAQTHDADYYYQRANWRESKRNFDGAIDDLNTAIKLKPNDSRNYNARGIIYEKTGKYEAARTDFEYALSLNPYSAEALHNIRNLNNKINNTVKYSGGINSASAFPASVPRSEISYARTTGNTPGNIQAWQQGYRQTGSAPAPARTTGNTPEDIQAWQQGYRQTGSAPAATPAYNSAPAWFPENTPVSSALSTTGYPSQLMARPASYYAAQGRDGVKIKADSGAYSPINSGYNLPYGGNSAYKNVPVFEFPIKKIFIAPDAEKYNLLGLRFSERGRFDEAIKQFNAAIEVYPGYAAAYNNRGAAFAGKGDLKSAALDFDQALRINPYYYDAQFNRERVKSSGLKW
jgi:tetratricopeptide (TPR) repeat protein